MAVESTTAGFSFGVSVQIVLEDLIAVALSHFLTVHIRLSDSTGSVGTAFSRRSSGMNSSGQDCNKSSFTVTWSGHRGLLRQSQYRAWSNIKRIKQITVNLNEVPFSKDYYGQLWYISSHLLANRTKFAKIVLIRSSCTIPRYGYNTAECDGTGNVLYKWEQLWDPRPRILDFCPWRSGLASSMLPRGWVVAEALEFWYLQMIATAWYRQIQRLKFC